MIRPLNKHVVVSKMNEGCVRETWLSLMETEDQTDDPESFLAN
jgi:hypothetical protein